MSKSPYFPSDVPTLHKISGKVEDTNSLLLAPFAGLVLYRLTRHRASREVDSFVLVSEILKSHETLQTQRC